LDDYIKKEERERERDAEKTVWNVGNKYKRNKIY
jgi:hypothetical protein